MERPQCKVTVAAQRNLAESPSSAVVSGSVALSVAWLTCNATVAAQRNLAESPSPSVVSGSVALSVA